MRLRYCTQRSWYKQGPVTCVRYSRSCPSASAVTRTPLQLKLACSSPHIKLNYYITILSLTLAPQNDQHLIDGLQCEVILPPSRPHPSLHFRSHLSPPLTITLCMHRVSFHCTHHDRIRFSCDLSSIRFWSHYFSYSITACFKNPSPLRGTATHEHTIHTS